MQMKNFVLVKYFFSEYDKSRLLKRRGAFENCCSSTLTATLVATKVDPHRRQILTTKVDPRTVRENIFIMRSIT